jgi:PAS domain S-box-containing protein
MSDFKRVDLHLHSDLSDGHLSPEALVRSLVKARVQCAALTDHDNIDGLVRFRRAAERHGLAVISGVELFASFHDKSIHLLAYGFAEDDARIRALTRASLPVDKALHRLHGAGAKVFLAHPLHLTRDMDELEAHVLELREAGLDGIEALHAPHTPEEQAALVALAERHGLLVVAGSDFHGPSFDGSGSCGVDMPAEHWRRFREALGDSPSGAGRFTLPPPRTVALDWRRFLLGIVLPSLLTIALSVTLLFAVLVPTMERSLLTRKREMIRELTNSAWSILAEYEREASEGRITREEAQGLAIERIRHMQYGEDGKDYFWITDMHPRMVMHPYRGDLDGADLRDFTDLNGVRLFVEFVRVVQDQQSGYVNYVWQWLDQPDRLVPKESFVRGFEPWQWIIGTGVYMDDVHREIDVITGRMVDYSVLVTLLVGALLLIVAHQSLKIERRRRGAETDLHLSHEKFRTLAESATEGTLVVLDQRCAYANRTMLEMLGHTEAGLALLDIHDVLAADAGHGGTEMIDDLLAGRSAPVAFETALVRRDGTVFQALVTPTRVHLGEREGLVLHARDMSRHSALIAELGASRDRLRALTETVELGVFRIALDASGSFVELSGAGRRMLGWDDDAPAPTGMRDLLVDAGAYDHLLRRITAHRVIRAATHTVRRADGAPITVSLSAVLVEDEAEQSTESASDHVPRCDGIIEDVTEHHRIDLDREAMMAQLQTSLLFLNEPVRDSAQPLHMCPLDTTAEQAAALMARHATSAIGVGTPGENVVGIVTESDLCTRLLAPRASASLPVFRIMTSPVHDVSESTPICEAIARMREHGTRHLLLRNEEGRCTGLVRDCDLVRLDRHSATVLTREIRAAASFDDLVRCQERLAPLVGSLVDAGALSTNIARMVTLVGDAVMERVLAIALEELGPPPVRFAFMTLGSGGRAEQTLRTDQDNGIIYEDPSEAEAERVAAWFVHLGQVVCDELHRAGYAWCKGDMMARNPRWTQPLSQWRRLFTHWILEPDAQELLQFSIFFDGRCGGGEESLVRELHSHIRATLQNQPPFFIHLAQNTLLYRPPIGMFGKLVTGSAGAAPHTFDLKEAMLPIVSFARLYALQHGISATNTTDRLDQLHAQGVLREDHHRELVQIHRHLMQMRLRHQVLALLAGQPPENAIDVRSLTRFETALLKQALSQIATMQRKVSSDYLGGGA